MFFTYLSLYILYTKCIFHKIYILYVKYTFCMDVYLGILVYILIRFCIYFARMYIFVYLYRFCIQAFFCEHQVFVHAKIIMSCHNAISLAAKTCHLAAIKNSPEHCVSVRRRKAGLQKGLRKTVFQKPTFDIIAVSTSHYCLGLRFSTFQKLFCFH